MSELEKLFAKERRKGWFIFQPSPGEGSLFIENEPRSGKVSHNTRMRFLGFIRLVTEDQLDKEG